MSIRNWILLPLAVVGFVVLGALGGCTAGQVKDNLVQVDQRIEQADKGIAIAEQTITSLEPALMLLPEAERAKAEESIRLAREAIAGYETTKATLVKIREDLTEQLKDAQDSDSATWATIGTIASNAVTAVFSPGGLLTTGIALVTGIAGLIKGRKNGEKDAKTIVNAVDALRVRSPAVASAMKDNKDIFVTTLSPKAWELVEGERTT